MLNVHKPLKLIACVCLIYSPPRPRPRPRPRGPPRNPPRGPPRGAPRGAPLPPLEAPPARTGPRGWPRPPRASFSLPPRAASMWLRFRDGATVLSLRGGSPIMASRFMASGSTKYRIEFPRSVIESITSGSSPAVFIFTSFKTVFMFGVTLATVPATTVPSFSSIWTYSDVIFIRKRTSCIADSALWVPGPDLGTAALAHIPPRCASAPKVQGT